MIDNNPVTLQWTRLCSQIGLPPMYRGRDGGLLLSLRERFSDDQILWLQERYFEDTLYPRVADFVGWVDRFPPDDIPDPLLCQAYNSKNPEAVEMADEIVSMKSNWFPTEETEERITRLEARLQTVHFV